MNHANFICQLILGILIFATTIHFGISFFYTSPETSKVWLRIKSWWIIAIFSLTCLFLGPWSIISLFFCVAMISSWEFLALNHNTDLERYKYFGVILIFLSFALLAGLQSFEAIFFVLLLTSFNDVFQYLFGKAFGQRSLAPSISPKKTIEGFWGGIIGTSLTASALGPYLLELPVIYSFFIGFGMAVSGTIGDLSISFFKRKAKVKDTGKLIPGHGGMLDRVDSLLFSAPYFYFIFYFTIKS